MKNRFEQIRIYDDELGFRVPYSNIEFVLCENLFKHIATMLSISQNEVFTTSKKQDGRYVLKPLNYEQFKKYLSETKIDKYIGDVRVSYEQQAPAAIHSVDDLEMEGSYYMSNHLGLEGYETLLACATEMLYEGKTTDEARVSHKKREFIQQCNKVHKELLSDFRMKNQTMPAQ